MALDDPRVTPRRDLGDFWLRLEALESDHRDARREHDLARRRLEAARGAADQDLKQSWDAYCDAIARLDAATAELENFRGAEIRAFAE
jgi:hypothetical protein